MNPADPVACVRPHCNGHYGAGGYCDECGRKVPLGSAGPTSPTDVTADRVDATEPSDAVSVSASGRAPRLPAVPGQVDRTAEPSRRASTPRDTNSGDGWTGDGSWAGPRVAQDRAAAFAPSRSHSAGRLGSGLVNMPTVAAPDPVTVAITNLEVPESRRYCRNCKRAVGRGRAGRPAIAEGYCPACRTQFSFVPDLTPGDVVHGRYELNGCLARGGQGWIYLARDLNVSDHVSDRWVVLKGLIDAADPEAQEAAVAERRFLVSVDHPEIVKIHDFVSHPHHRTGIEHSYIVMEYVGGRSLREIMQSRRGADGRYDPLPLPQVIVYGMAVLAALTYLHERGLVYCDMKPDNVIHAEDRLKLIDLGAVSKIGEHQSMIYSTRGYQSPELEDLGPSVQSDIYAVGRMLAELSFDFRGSTTTFANRLPSPAHVPLLAAEESFYRLLQRATHTDRLQRFSSAPEMAEQLLGVLRQTLTGRGEPPMPLPSTLFTAERRAFGTEAGVAGPKPLPAMDVRPAVLALPLPQVDVVNPGTTYPAGVRADRPSNVEALVAALSTAPDDSVEVALQRVRAWIEQDDLDHAARDLDELATKYPADWRVDWYTGLNELARGEPRGAMAAFDQVYSTLPGELAPQLALAVACEAAGDLDKASRYYARVWHTDHHYVSAAFGFARILQEHGDRSGAVAVLDEVPENSSHHVAAKVAAVRTLLGAQSSALTQQDVADAARRAQELLSAGAVPGPEWLTVEVLQTTLAWLGTTQRADRAVTIGGDSEPAVQILDYQLNERALRFGLEKTYRRLADGTYERTRRTALVDRANAIRPRTWW